MSFTFRRVSRTLSLLASIIVVDWSQTAVASAQEFHAQRLGDRSSPAASIAAMSWLAGHWHGDGLGGFNDEVWSEPRDGVMMGMFRHFKQEKTVFYEFLMIVEEKGTLILKLKHFNPDFSGWEEKNAFVDFPLVKLEPAAIHFDGLSFVRESADALTIYLLLRDKSGQVREEVFRMRRAS